MDSFLSGVLVVGAGPTGLTLACELARRGTPFRIVEAAPGPQPGSRGKGVQPRTLELFERLGLTERVLAHGRAAMPMRLTAPDGSVTVGGAAPAELQDRPDIPYTTSVITPEWRVEEALRAKLTALGGTVEFGVRLDGFEQTDDAVVARLVSERGTETVTADWLVGADGGHSVVRKGAGIEFVGDTREDVRMIVADVAVDGLDREAWHLWRHAEGMVTLCPLPSTDLFQYGASIAPGQDPALTLANAQALLEQRTGRTDVRLHEPEWRSLWRANVRLAERYRAGRVFVAGDAAHIHSPAGGQGMNTGIQDAFNLGWKLAAVVAGAGPDLLDTYEDERRPVAAHVLQLSDARLARIIAEGSMPIRRDASTTQLDIGYRGSSLARDDRDATADLRAGDRAPDATGLVTTGGPRRLFELLRGTRSALLVFDRHAVEIPGTDVLRVVPTAEAAGDVVDTAGHLAAAYGAGPSTLVVVRPDGHVGLISDAGDLAAVESYLRAFA